MCENQTVLQVEELSELQPRSLIDIITGHLSVLWKDWPRDMEVINLPRANDQRGDFSMRGVCPHCSRPSAFIKVTTMYVEEDGPRLRFVAATQCQACLEFVLAVVLTDGPNRPYKYEAHFPLGKPNDDVSEDVPTEIRSAFKEALRCYWVGSNQATVLMCRRALEISCGMELAVGKDLFAQIDDLAVKGRITEPLKKMAHRIRLLGNKGAHGDYSDINDKVIDKDAEDAITFMRHYLGHVYILPAQLK